MKGRKERLMRTREEGWRNGFECQRREKRSERMIRTMEERWKNGFKAEEREEKKKKNEKNKRRNLEEWV